MFHGDGGYSVPDCRYLAHDRGKLEGPGPCKFQGFRDEGNMMQFLRMLGLAVGLSKVSYDVGQML